MVLKILCFVVIIVGVQCRLGTRRTRSAISEYQANVDVENLHASGHEDASQKQFAPKFKHPSKLFKMDMKAAGSTIRLKCAADGNPTPNITWFKNNNTIQRSYFTPSYGKWSLTLDELTKTDTGNYTCVVCNQLGCIDHTVVLYVQERLYAKPVLARAAENQTKLVGETAKFTCEFLSNMHPNIYWLFFKKNEFIYNFDDTNEENDNTRIMTTEDPNDKQEVLTIFNVTKEDEGWYVCVAMNTLGKTTAKGYLTVLDERLDTKPKKPVVARAAENQTKLAGQTAEFSCAFFSDFPPSVYWKYFKKYEYINNLNDTNEDNDTGKNMTAIHPHGLTPDILTIYNVTKEDEGWYVCVAISALGKTTTEGYLTVLDNPTLDIAGELRLFRTEFATMRAEIAGVRQEMAAMRSALGFKGNQIAC